MKRIMNDELLQQLKKHEGKWVALFGPDEAPEIVAIGGDAADAARRATENGYAETTLLKVLPSEVAYVPMA